MMRVETQPHLLNEDVCEEESCFHAPHAAHTTSCVWIFLVLEIALTVLASHAVWAKAGGLAPFSTPATASPFKENKENQAR